MQKVLTNPLPGLGGEADAEQRAAPAAGCSCGWPGAAAPGFGPPGRGLVACFRGVGATKKKKNQIPSGEEWAVWG